MSVISIQTGVTGLAGVNPCIIYIDTTNTVAEVTTSGFLDGAKSEGFTFHSKQMALVSTQIAGVYTTNFYTVAVSSSTGSVTLTAI